MTVEEQRHNLTASECVNRRNRGLSPIIAIVVAEAAITAGLVGLAFVAAIVVIILLTVLIDWLRDPKTVDWLENSLWGDDNGYDSAYPEPKDFKKALRADHL